MKILKLTMCIALLSASMSIEQSQPIEDNQHCGQYGFRCVDSESFQICTFPDSEGVTEAPEIIRKCLDHNVCDEDNIAYCTPLEQIQNESPAKASGKGQKKVQNKRSGFEKFSRKDNIQMRSNALRKQSLGSSDNDPFGFNMEDETEIETTTTADYDDYPSFKYQNFECESFGYFPDIYNASMFWHCDHKNKGKGYIVRHMLCSSGRVFNPRHKECVMIGTTRNIRNDGQSIGKSREPQDTFKKKRRPFKNVNLKFSCENRLPGKYADTENCRIYHYCLPRSFASFDELTFLCPDHLAYDSEKETCNRISFERCAERAHPLKNRILYIKVDAIVLQKQKCKLDLRRHNPDCSEYHLCYNDEVVHMKCPDSYRFDENLLTCQPQHLVSCE